MNSDTQSVSASKYEKLVKGPNTQINKHNNPDQITNVRQIFNNLNQSIQQKQKPNSNLTSTSHISPSTKHINATADKCQTHKLVDSKQGLFQQFDKKTFLLDTYARIVANNNRRCPKRLRELAKPKRQARSNQNDYVANFDLNYSRATKTYRKEDKRDLKESRKD